MTASKTVQEELVDKPVTPTRLDELRLFLSPHMIEWHQEVDAALRELRELRQRTEAMRPYLVHKGNQYEGEREISKYCGTYVGQECDCGLDALLAGKPCS